MAHNQEELKVLGRIVASNKKVKLSEILIDYGKNLNLCLQYKPTIKTHSNVIMHIFGFFSKEFSDLEKEKFFELLKNYKDEKMTIGDILAEIHPIVFRFNKTYLSSQTYFLLYSNLEIYIHICHLKVWTNFHNFLILSIKKYLRYIHLTLKNYSLNFHCLLIQMVV